MSWGGGMKHLCLSPEFCYGFTVLFAREVDDKLLEEWV